MSGAEPEAEPAGRAWSVSAWCVVADPRRVAQVGDTPVDLEEGTNAGCAVVIGVSTGATTADRLREFPHTHLVDSVADIPALLPAHART